MRKLFRFKYEPCTGTCYAWCDHLITELRNIDEFSRKLLVKQMVDAHNKLCDNPEYSFGVDVDENKTVFVAHFRTPEATNLYYKNNFKECVEAVCNNVLKTIIPQKNGKCIFGDNGSEDLGNEILKFCVDEFFNQLKERHCECKLNVNIG